MTRLPTQKDVDEARKKMVLLRDLRLRELELMDTLTTAMQIKVIWPEAFKDDLACLLRVVRPRIADQSKMQAQLVRADGEVHDITMEQAILIDPTAGRKN